MALVLGHLMICLSLGRTIRFELEHVAILAILQHSDGKPGAHLTSGNPYGEA